MTMATPLYSSSSDCICQLIKGWGSLRQDKVTAREKRGKGSYMWLLTQLFFIFCRLNLTAGYHHSPKLNSIFNKYSTRTLCIQVRTFIDNQHFWAAKERWPWQQALIRGKVKYFFSIPVSWVISANKPEKLSQQIYSQQ